MERSATEEGLAAAVHEIIGGLGTVRLAASAAGDEPDAKFRAPLLDSIEAEVTRLVGLVAAVPLLTEPTNLGPASSVSAAEIAAAAIQQARRRGVTLTVTGPDVGRVHCVPALGVVIGAIAVMAAADGRTAGVALSCRPGDEELLVEISGSPVPDGATVRGLLRCVGGVRLDADAGISFVVGRAT